MTTDLDRTCPGCRHAASANDRKKRRKLMTVHPGKKIMILGVMSVLLVLTIRVAVVNKWSARQFRAGGQKGSSQKGIQGVGLSSTSQRPGRSSGSNVDSDVIIITRPTVQEAFQGKITFVVNQTEFDPEEVGSGGAFKTVVEPNRNVLQYGLTLFTNVCARPDGAIVTVGVTEEELLAEISKVPALHEDWFSTYNCSPANDCMGFEAIESEGFPRNARWVTGTTTHIVPYKENVLHNFADRLWPHLAGAVYPLNETIPPTNHFLVHRISTWLYQAGHNMDRNTFMYQIRIHGETAPKADFLAMDGFNDANDLVCFERFVLACTTCDRVTAKLGHSVTDPAVLNYRNNALRFFGISEPVVPLPPRRLRVAIYGRRDAARRRIDNVDDVVRHLRSYRNPPFVVTPIDELLASPSYNQSVPEVVSLMSQTDIYIIVHGASTWATLFLPMHAAVIEIEGPCGPYTWMHNMAHALGLKHDRSNPWDRAVASPRAGNTTECVDPHKTPDMTVDLRKLDDIILSFASPTFGAEDRISRHWKHNWQPNSSG